MKRYERIYGTVTERLYRRCEIDRATGCINWLGAKNRKGYGVMGVENRRTRSVHRLSYTLWFGPIPKGHEVHHECRNTCCVNPGHLRAVHPRDHPDAFTMVNGSKTHCPRGHLYDKIIRHPSGRRIRGCKTCNNAATIAWWAKHGGRAAQRAYLQAWREKRRALGLYP